VAGRTDAGVHAWGQVASYGHEALDPLRLNSLLPDDVAVLASEPMDALSTLAAARRAARTATASTFPRPLTVRARPRLPLSPSASIAMRSTPVPQPLVGRHDFTAFTFNETYHTRFVRDVLHAEWRGDDALSFWIEADSFMRQMNRVLVGTMLESRPAHAASMISPVCSRRARSAAGRTAPAHGLYSPA